LTYSTFVFSWFVAGHHVLHANPDRTTLQFLPTSLSRFREHVV
jgi:hypothetical protein